MKKQIILLVLAVVACALPARAAKLIVADGNIGISSGPINCDNNICNQHNQMIYPAEKLLAMRGKRITSMTFYILY